MLRHLQLISAFVTAGLTARTEARAHGGGRGGPELVVQAGPRLQLLSVTWRALVCRPVETSSPSRTLGMPSPTRFQTKGADSSPSHVASSSAIWSSLKARWALPIHLPHLRGYGKKGQLLCHGDASQQFDQSQGLIKRRIRTRHREDKSHTGRRRLECI